MFGPRVFASGLTIPKVIGGLSKGLGVINQIIPLYKEAKPLVSNARNAINLLKEMSNTTTNRVMEKTQTNMAPIKEKINKISNNNNINNNQQKGLTFFQ